MTFQIQNLDYVNQQKLERASAIRCRRELENTIDAGEDWNIFNRIMSLWRASSSELNSRKVTRLEGPITIKIMPHAHLSVFFSSRARSHLTLFHTNEALEISGESGVRSVMRVARRGHLDSKAHKLNIQFSSSFYASPTGDSILSNLQDNFFLILLGIKAVFSLGRRDGERGEKGLLTPSY